MIKKLFYGGYFDYSKFISNNINKLSLTIVDAFVLTKILDLYKETNHIDIKKLGVCCVDKKNLDKSLANLIDRKFINFYLENDENGVASEAVSLDGFFERVAYIINNETYDDNDTYMIVNIVQEGLNKPLTANDLELLTSVINENRFKREDFENALEKLKQTRRVITVKSLLIELENEKTGIIKEEKETPSFVKDFVNQLK